MANQLMGGEMEFGGMCQKKPAGDRRSQFVFLVPVAPALAVSISLRHRPGGWTRSVPVVERGPSGVSRIISPTVCHKHSRYELPSLRGESFRKL